MSVPKALTIAGSDSGGGAGIQADLKTFSAFRVFGMSVITAITAQNSFGVQGVENLPPAIVAQQLRSVLGDFGADAAKCGMLSTAPIIEAVAEALREHPIEKLVVDPVMVAKSGAALLEPDARLALIERILPLALVVTPNLPEAAALLDTGIAADEREMEAQAAGILALGARAVLIKGGHGADAMSVDLLFDGPTVTRYAAKRIPTHNTHGTGCTLSSAIAAGLAKGQELAHAARIAKAYVTDAIAGADRLAVGQGQGPIHHFHAVWPSS